MAFTCRLLLVLFLVPLCFARPKDSESDKPATKSDVEIIYLNVISTVQARFATTLITSQVANRADSAKEVTFTAQLPDPAFISNFSMQIGEQIIYGNVKEKEKAKADFDAAKARGESTGLVAKKPRETNSFTISVNVAAQSKVKFNLTYQELFKRVHGVYKQIINLQPDQPVSELKVDVFITERGEITNVKVPKFGEKTGEKTNKELLAAEDEPNVEIKPIVKSNGTNSIQIHYQPKAKTKTEVYNGQLVVLYDVKRDSTAGDIEVVNGYFVHFFAPEGLQKRPKDIVFVLDKSGSMQGRKMTQLKDAMKTILNDLSSDDSFQIIFFSDKVENWRNEFMKASPDNVKAATTFVQDTEADGGTNIYESLQEGIRILKKSTTTNVPMILFLTDGEPTVGETNRDKIVNDTASANDQERKIIIQGVAFGNDADYNILQKISGRNKGLARRVYEDSDSSIQLAGFYEEISSPLLTNVKIDYLNETVDVSSVVQDSSNNYYDGSEVVVVGKLKDSKSTGESISAKVSGQGPNGNVDIISRSRPPIVCREPIPVDFLYFDGPVGAASPAGGVWIEPRPMWCCPPPYCCWWRGCPPIPTPPPKEPLPATSVGGFVERMWAYQTIKKMLKDSDLKDGDKEKEEAKKKALELSLKYHFVTDLTSMVVVKPNDTKSSTLEEDKSVPPAPGGISSFSSANAFGGPLAASGFRGPPGGGFGIGGGAAGPIGPFPPPPPPSASGALAPAPAPAPPPPQPHPPPDTGDSKATEEKEVDEIRPLATGIPAATAAGATAAPSRTTTKTSAPACTMEIIFIRDNANVSDSIDLARGVLVDDTLRQIQNQANISGRAAKVITISDLSYSVANMAPLSVVLDFRNRKDQPVNVSSSLAQILDTQFGLYKAPNVKRYVFFMVAARNVKNFIDTATVLKTRGVVVSAIYFNKDDSEDFIADLNKIAMDGNHVHRYPPVTADDLSQELIQCPTGPPAVVGQDDQKSAGVVENDQKSNGGSVVKTPSGCTMELIFVRDNTKVSNSIDLFRGSFLEATIRQIQNQSNITGSAAMVEALSNQSYSIDRIAPLSDLLDFRNRKPQPPITVNNYSLLDVLDSQFTNYYIKDNVKRYVIFAVTTKYVEYLFNTVNELKFRRGVVVYVVSFLDDTSVETISNLEFIAGDHNRLLKAPPQTASDLSKQLIQCPAGEPVFVDRDRNRNAPACSLEIALIKQSLDVSQEIDLSRGRYVENALRPLLNSTNINARLTVLSASPDSQAIVGADMDSLPVFLNYRGPKEGSMNSTASSPLVQVLRTQFNNFITPNVKRYIIFMVTANADSIKFAEDVSSFMQGFGVTIFAVSMTDDNSAELNKTLMTITRDATRIFKVPPSNGADLGNVLGKCPTH